MPRKRVIVAVGAAVATIVCAAPGHALALEQAAPAGEIDLGVVVQPAQPAAGQSFTHVAVVANTGAAAITSVAVQLDRCQWVFPVLPAGASRTFRCPGVARLGRMRLTAEVSGTTGSGVPVTAMVVTPLAVAAADPARPPPPAPAAVAPPGPPATARPPAPPNPPPAPPAPPRPSPRQAALPSPAPARPSPTPVAPVLAQPPVPSTRQPSPIRFRPAAHALALPSPGRTAAIVAVLGVMVMTVSVGAISAAVRPR